MEYKFTSKLWRYDGPDAWVFATVPTDIRQEIRELFAPPGPGFGSIRVTVEINGVSWQTSVFPDKTSGSYVLPLKKDVRTRAGVDAGDTVQLTITFNPEDR